MRGARALFSLCFIFYLLTFTKAATALSISFLVCAADICTRILAFPSGTTGYENAIT